MKRVMVDNWFLKEASEPDENGKPKNPQAYGSLLSALVLWEEVCYPQNPNNAVWAKTEELSACLHPLYDTGSNVRRLSVRLMERFLADDGIPDPYLTWMQDPESVVNASALGYLAFSAKNGCDYLPAPQRQRFLETEDYARHVRNLLPRMRMMGILDEAAEEYYKESYSELLDLSAPELRMPVLGDYIVSASPAGISPLEYALHLRQEGPVIRYRDYLDRLEQAIEQQRWKELRRLLAASREAVAEVLDLDRKGLGSVTVKLLPTPSLVMNYGGLHGELSAKPAFSADLKPARRMHLSFLRDLTRYAVNERPLFPEAGRK